MSGTSPRIELSGLGYHVDGKTILRQITFSSDAKRIGIVGRNGSGKSTLARLLAGLLKPSEGEVRIAGQDLYEDRKAALRTVGILFQNPDHQIIFPTVVEEVAFGLTQLGQSKSQAEASARRTLEAFSKSHWAEASISTLSQGQKHLVCLMSITAMAPPVLILDEPFAGLDIPTKAQLTRYLAQYQGHLVHISHDPVDLQGYDELLWLEQGNIVQTGNADTVLSAYLAAMTAKGEDDDISDLTG